MISRRRPGVLLLLCLLVLIGLGACQSPRPPLSACEDPLGCISLGPQDPLKLAVLVPLSSGEIGSSWTDRLHVYDLALQERDRQFLDHPIQMQILDDACGQEQGIQAALEILAEPQVVAVLNASCSLAAQVISPLLSRSGLVMISSSNTAPSLTGLQEPEENGYPGYFRTAHNDAYTGEAAAIAAFGQLRLSSAAVIHTGDIYTRGLANTFSRGLIERGGEIVFTQELRPGEQDLVPILEQIVETDAQLLAFFLYRPQGDYLLRQKDQVPGMERIALMTGDSLAQATFIEALGDQAQGLIFAVPRVNRGPRVIQLERRFRNELGLEPSDIFYAQAYDAIQLLFHGLEQIAQQGPEGDLQIGRQALRDVLHTTNGFSGVTGDLSCTDWGDCGVTQITVIQVDDPTLDPEQIWDNVIYDYSPNP